MTTDPAIVIKASLDTAWIAAEQALGERWRIRSLIEIKNGWEVVATDGKRIRVGSGRTPVAAIRALTAEPTDG